MLFLIASMLLTSCGSKTESSSGSNDAAVHLADVQSISSRSIECIEFSLDGEGGSQEVIVKDEEEVLKIWSAVLKLSAGNPVLAGAEDAGIRLRIHTKDGETAILRFEADILVNGESRCEVKNMGDLETCLLELAGNTTGDNGEPIVDSGEDVRITPTAASSVTLETYTDPSGYFSIQIPSGWTVSTFNVNDPIYYGLIVCDPQNDTRGIFVQRAVIGYQTQTTLDILKMYGGDTVKGLYYLSTPTTEGILRSMITSVNGGGTFEVQDNLGAAYGMDILHAITTTPDGRQIEGIFGCQPTQIDYGMNAILTFGFGLNWIQAPAGEFPEWEPVLSKCLGSLQFSQQFESIRAASWAQVVGTSQYISESWNQISDSVMSSWESRSGTYDIISQEQSDATLGYDRIVDTETGETYRANLNFMDSYNGTGYEKVPSGSTLYNQAVSGYID